MKVVICNLKGAGSNIDGIEFHSENGLMVSCEVSDELAAAFCRLDGFEMMDKEEPVKTKKPVTKKAP